MTEAERQESEARRKLIAAQSRAANPPRPVRIVPAADRSDEILERTGFHMNRPGEGINWGALTRDG